MPGRGEKASGPEPSASLMIDCMTLGRSLYLSRLPSLLPRAGRARGTGFNFFLRVAPFLFFPERNIYKNPKYTSGERGTV